MQTSETSGTVFVGAQCGTFVTSHSYMHTLNAERQCSEWTQIESHIRDLFLCTPQYNVYINTMYSVQYTCCVEYSVDNNTDGTHASKRAINTNQHNYAECRVVSLYGTSVQTDFVICTRRRIEEIIVLGLLFPHHERANARIVRARLVRNMCNHNCMLSHLCKECML